jgi:beta-glucosidase
MAKIHASKHKEITEREIKNMDRSRKIATQGIVLLKNDGALPIEETGKKIALYGNGARHTIQGGTGSGIVNSRLLTNVEEGLVEANFKITTDAWLTRYDKALEQAQEEYNRQMLERIHNGEPDIVLNMFIHPFQAPPIVEVTQEDLEQSDTDTAVYILSRNSGEGKDRCDRAGDYELFEEEKEAIGKIASFYKKVIVVLNVGGVMDTEYLRNTEGIQAILVMSQLGNMSGGALADILSGAVTPSGHLATTWAEYYDDYPSAATFSHRNGNLDDEYYEEGIYVGYRYFDTFNVKPAYPFGYGLTYTNFSVETKKVTVEQGMVNIQVAVTNVGTKYIGSEVVQVYYSAPEGELEKPYQELAAYEKTKELKPGETEEITVTYPVEKMASYEEKTASYVLEPGTYYVRVGTHSRNTKIVAGLVLEEKKVTLKLKNLFTKDRDMNQLSAKGITPYHYDTEEQEKAEAQKILIKASDLTEKEISYEDEKIKASALAEKKITAEDVRSGRATVDELVSQLTIAEMAELCVGTARGGVEESSIIGAASAVCPGAAGDTTSILLEERDIRNLILADGPAGLRLSTKFMADPDGNVIPGTKDAAFPGMELFMEQDKPIEIPEGSRTYYQYCTAIPIATALAQTWNRKLMEEAGDIVGEEMKELGVHLWLAPGMNIHRNPLCGRNFEYFSEEPLIAGICAAMITNGVQKHGGVGTTIKHFALNNQEDNRMHTNVHISERAIREIYLKGFEIAVKYSQPKAIMTSYNLIQGVHAANNRELITEAARKEWEFQGMVMTDWETTKIEKQDPPLKYGSSNAAGCIKAGNDLTMPGSEQDVQEIIRSVDAKEGSVPYPITKEELMLCAKHMIQTILSSSAYEE